MASNLVMQDLTEPNKKWVGLNDTYYLFSAEDLARFDLIEVGLNEDLVVRDDSHLILPQLAELELRVNSITYALQSLPNQLDIAVIIQLDANLKYLRNIHILRNQISS